MTDENKPPHPMSRRFRGFLPVVVDVETAGFNPERDALLEVAAVILTMDDDGWVRRAETHVQQIDPFEGANLEQSALDFTGIDPWNPEREAVPEREGLSEIFSPIRKAVKNHDCKRAVLVGHNATFDHNFIFAAALRADIRRNPVPSFLNLRYRHAGRPSLWPHGSGPGLQTRGHSVQQQGSPFRRL